jgi:hypothetical protein
MSIEIKAEIKRTWEYLIYPALSPFLFLISMCQMFVFTNDGGMVSLGMILTGWAIWFGWYANIFYIFSLLTRRFPTASFSYCLVAFLLAITIAPLNISSRSFSKVLEYGWGFYLWIMAIIIQMIRQAGFLWPNETQYQKKISTLSKLGLVLVTILFLCQSTHSMNFKVYLKLL